MSLQTNTQVINYLNDTLSVIDTRGTRLMIEEMKGEVNFTQKRNLTNLQTICYLKSVEAKEKDIKAFIDSSEELCNWNMEYFLRNMQYDVSSRLFDLCREENVSRFNKL